MLKAEMRDMIRKGWEISWFTTNKNSFDWTDINVDTNGFVEKSYDLDFDYVDVGYFHPEKKETKYLCYEMIKDDV